MIRPHIDITMYQGYISSAHPPMQWNETTSQRKMLTDVREWLHNHHPSWRSARVHLNHIRGMRTYTESFSIERRVAHE
jgi:hypothetical protein